ncbi:unnamed protein product [Rotaria sp. Silwood1]|nr:unnamed protein product [Rotaria sp. Silwood1]
MLAKNSCWCYGFDSTISICTIPLPLQVHNESIDIIYPEIGKLNTNTVPIGIGLQQLYIKRTRYLIKNTVLDRSISKFYIDHIADSSLGGYVVTTQNRCIKSVKDCSRFELKFEPQQDIEFIVDEQARHSKKIFVLTALELFVEKQVPNLVQAKIIENRTVNLIQKMIAYKFI